jgi:hypothetical protein
MEQGERRQQTGRALLLGSSVYFPLKFSQLKHVTLLKISVLDGWLRLTVVRGGVQFRD